MDLSPKHSLVLQSRGRRFGFQPGEAGLPPNLQTAGQGKALPKPDGEAHGPANELYINATRAHQRHLGTYRCK